MEIYFEKNAVAFIALVYNYISNESDRLSEKDVEDFIEKVCFNLGYNHVEYEMLTDEKDLDELYFYGIEFDYEKREYILKSLNNLVYLYDNQHKEVIKASLQRDSLSEIYVNRDKLKIVESYSPKSGIKDVYSSECASAKRTTASILEAQGCKNIKIGNAIPGQLEGDKGYHVRYSCDELFEKVNVSEIKLKK